jgi:copper chaperone CopZ
MEIKVVNMSCEHCVSKIHQALKLAKIKHKINLSTKTVTVKDEERTSAIENITKIGYIVE